MPSGGKREGAGRKKEKRTIESEKAREYLISRIAVELEPIVTAQIEAAKGLYVEELGPDGQRIKIYKKVPALSTGEYLLNQGAGKPTETVKGDISGKITLTFDKAFEK